MSHFSHYPLQAAIYQALTSNSGLMALITGVYDRPPQGTPYPYVLLGELSGNDSSTKTTTGMQYLVTLYIYSRQGGRKESTVIMESLHTLLHQVSLSVTGQTLVSMRFVSSDIALENDGVTYQGIMRFNAFLEAN